MRVRALEQSILSIQAFIDSTLSNPAITFFCAGIIAEKHPEIIRMIADLGHEIGCHYHFHDSVRHEDVDRFDRQLARARDHLQSASGQDVVGFRAPRFSIDGDDAARYQIIERHFRYDSSLNLDTSADLADAYRTLGLTSLQLIPVGKHRVAPFLPDLKTGGSYFKLFPLWVSRTALRKSIENGLQPMLYLHPYEFTADGAFRLGWNDLRGLGLAKRGYFHLRQHQWHRVGNRTVRAKLERVFAEFSDGGPMRNLVRPSATV
ncbi:MAG: hypothetical protein CVU07_11330 [Bacteroidetes bacterium HGW-Bacteroidetes-23]|nr:MAG: hypothetical protein CVU07_11330 [Bacteroidetes bacterium HGW-Bacteroidetes-23]